MNPYDYNAHASDAKRPLTVKEFKDLGVEFVHGDKIDFYDGCAGAISKVCADDIGNKPYCYGGEVFYFAWRPLNTLPDNPKFKFEYNAGSIRVQWRPLLDQSVKPDYKPVFTQEMADDCIPLLAGMMFV
jgi:hypothetical protein